jgi:hypothetical protein
MGFWRLFPLFLASIAFSNCIGQQTPTQSQKLSYAADPASLPIAISKVEKGQFGLVDVEIIAERHAVQAVPLLETQFERSKDLDTRAKIANALVRLGKNDGPYWDFLAERARKLLHDPPPTPFDYDASGKAVPQQPSMRLTNWAMNHDLSIQEAFELATYQAPGDIIEIGSSDDRRAIPILRDALVAENHFIQMQAALGLAELHDTESVPAIISVCEHAPREAASAIAQSLVYFDDPLAQKAFDTYVAKNMAQTLREARLHGKTPYR